MEADVMRQFLLQCSDNYGQRPSSTLTPAEDGGSELVRSSSRIGIGSRLEDIRRRERELELEEMLQALDLDRDGKVSLDDFIRLLVLDQGNVDGENETTKSNKAPPTEDESNGVCSSTDRRGTTVVERDNESESRHRGCILM